MTSNRVSFSSSIVEAISESLFIRTTLEYTPVTQLQAYKVYTPIYASGTTCIFRISAEKRVGDDATSIFKSTFDDSEEDGSLAYKSIVKCSMISWNTRRSIRSELSEIVSLCARSILAANLPNQGGGGLLVNSLQAGHAVMVAAKVAQQWVTRAGARFAHASSAWSARATRSRDPHSTFVQVVTEGAASSPGCSNACIIDNQPSCSSAACG